MPSEIAMNLPNCITAARVIGTLASGEELLIHLRRRTDCGTVKSILERNRFERNR